MDVKGGNRIPLFLDCLFLDGYPDTGDEPPAYQDENNGWNVNAMKMFCIPRHMGGVNAVFLDASARRVGMKELWELKWNKEYDISWGRSNIIWPDWMDNFN